MIMTTMMIAVLKHAVAFSKLVTCTLQFQPEAHNYTHRYVLDDENGSHTPKTYCTHAKTDTHTHTMSATLNLARFSKKAGIKAPKCACV